MISSDNDADRTLRLARQLVALDSSNPPGGERECVQLIASELHAAGIEPLILGQTAARPNLVARVAGRGLAPPLLLYGHTDVVPALAAEWRHHPFAADLVDGELWGRGTLDMKGGLAMLLNAFLAAASAPTKPPGDLLFAATSDEETGGERGAEFLVREHADLFAGVRHALSEFGGYTHHVGNRRLYPIQVAQKRRCTLRLTVRGESGHSATPRPGQAIGKLANALRAIERRQLPTHITPPVRHMITAMANGLGRGQATALRALLHPRLTEVVLRGAGTQAEDLNALLRNTAVPTIIRAGDTWNVIPSLAQADLDGRLVPGHDPSEIVSELQRILPAGSELEVVHADPAANHRPNLELLPLLTSVLKEEDPHGHPFPLVTAGMTDARHFEQLGIQTYGFLPMRLPPGLMPKLLHGTDERVPADALRDGTNAIGRIVDRYIAP